MTTNLFVCKSPGMKATHQLTYPQNCQNNSVYWYSHLVLLAGIIILQTPIEVVSTDVFTIQPKTKAISIFVLVYKVFSINDAYRLGYLYSFQHYQCLLSYSTTYTNGISIFSNESISFPDQLSCPQSFLHKNVLLSC